MKSTLVSTGGWVDKGIALYTRQMQQLLSIVNLIILRDLVKHTSGSDWVGHRGMILETESGPLPLPLWQSPLVLCFWISIKRTALSCHVLLPRCLCIAASPPCMGSFNLWVESIFSQLQEVDQCNRMLFSLSKERNLIICNNIDEPERHYAKWNKSGMETQVLC